MSQHVIMMTIWSAVWLIFNSTDHETKIVKTLPPFREDLLLVPRVANEAKWSGEREHGHNVGSKLSQLIGQANCLPSLFCHFRNEESHHPIDIRLP